MRRSRRRVVLSRCARMRRFRNWRSGTGCIRTRFTPGRSRFSTTSRACSREGRAVRAMARRSASVRRPSFTRDWPTDGRTGFLGQEARAMSAPDRRAMVERPGKELSVRRQCALVGVARSGIYRAKPDTGADDLAVLRRIDELHLELPFYGSRRMTFELSKEGRGLNRKRVRRLMRVMGIEALVPRPGTSRAAPGHKIYPYLLRGLKIVEPNHVWAADAGRHRFLDDFLQLSTPSPGDEQPDADGGVARRHGQNRGGGEGCGYAALLGQRKRVAHIPTAEAAKSGLILEGQGQARLHLKSNHPWSREWGPVHAEQPAGRFEFTFTPKHGSWLNLVEGFFSKLARSVPRHIRVASKQELKERIIAAMDEFNRHPVVHTWSYKLDNAA